MKPGVGRIVHFTDSNGTHNAAIITRVWSDTCVNLHVFPAGGGGAQEFTSVLYSETTPTDGRFSWHWPERES